MSLDRPRWLRAALVVLALVLSSCGDEGSAQSQAERCALCGMRVDPQSGWRAGARTSSGAELRFDTPKCLFRHHQREPGMRDAWVVEYYTQERRPARELFYVIGTDLEGPMGRDLVPVAGRDEADRLLRDHHGERVLAFGEVTREIVDGLFRPRAR